MRYRCPLLISYKNIVFYFQNVPVPAIENEVTGVVVRDRGVVIGNTENAAEIAIARGIEIAIVNVTASVIASANVTTVNRTPERDLAAERGNANASATGSTESEAEKRGKLNISERIV